MSRSYKIGEIVVYSKSKRSTSPGPRAKNVLPATRGDDYSYVVDKYWIVDEQLDEGYLLLRTRTGKTHEIHEDDPSLRRLKFWERLLFAAKFPAKQ